MAGWEGVGVSGTLTYKASGARYAREDRNPVLGVNYKPILV
jgi:hypothetical protein